MRYTPSYRNNLFRAYECSESNKINNNIHCTINCQLSLDVSLLLSVRAAKAGQSIVLRLNYVNVHVWPINEADNIYNNLHCTINCQRLQEEISSLPNQKLDSHNTIFSYIKVP